MNIKEQSLIDSLKQMQEATQSFFTAFYLLIADMTIRKKQLQNTNAQKNQRRKPGKKKKVYVGAISTKRQKRGKGEREKGREGGG